MCVKYALFRYFLISSYLVATVKMVNNKVLVMQTFFQVCMFSRHF